MIEHYIPSARRCHDGSLHEVRTATCVRATLSVGTIDERRDFLLRIPFFLHLLQEQESSSGNTISTKTQHSTTSHTGQYTTRSPETGFAYLATGSSSPWRRRTRRSGNTYMEDPASYRQSTQSARPPGKRQQLRSSRTLTRSLEQRQPLFPTSTATRPWRASHAQRSGAALND